jgi:RimJ/RimL family protein N-acetyltransferase
MAGDQEIGECSLDIYGETAEAGLMLLPDHWGQGYGTKVLELLKDIACGINVTAMRATTDRKNTAAVRLLMKSGYQQQKSGWMVRISDEGDDLSEGQEILLFARKI